MDSRVEKTLGPLAVKVVGWIASAVGGALLMMVLQSGARTEQLKSNTERLEKLEARVATVERDYATNKRVDDVLIEVRGIRVDLSQRMDDMLKLLIQQQQRGR